MPDCVRLNSVNSLSRSNAIVWVEGSIVEVCQTMGCWMTLRDATGDEVFVRLKDHEFLIPRNAAGHRTLIFGHAFEETQSVEQLKHYAHDAGKTPQEIEAIAQPQERLVFCAHTVWIAGPALDEPVAR